MSLGLVLAACTPSSTTSTDQPLRVAAAADLTRAFDELGKAFTARTGRAVVFTFGSTGLLARQLEQGAPFDVFAAANVAFVDDVVRAGACHGRSVRRYARGRLAVWSRRDGVTPPVSLDDLASPRFTRIAVANSEHAPYGMAANAALQHVGVFTAVEPRLVSGDNVRQALQFAESGNADVAITALSLVIDDTVNPWQRVDDALHPPLTQALVVCGERDVAAARAFADLVVSPDGQAILARHSFDPVPTTTTAP